MITLGLQQESRHIVDSQYTTAVYLTVGLDTTTSSDSRRTERVTAVSNELKRRLLTLQ